MPRFSRRTHIVIVIVVLVLAAIAFFWPESTEHVEDGGSRGLSATDLLRQGDDVGAYARVTGPRPLQFPEDHGPHAGYRHEWWYLTGNLQTSAGRHFGYQLTFFRVTVDPQPQPRESAWATSQVYMAHFALTDTSSGRFHDFERFSRAALGLAGAQTRPLRVWLEDWELRATDDGGWQVSATADQIELRLTLVSHKPVVLQGDRGYSRKGADPANASHYYSLTRLVSDGVLDLNGERFDVRGASWLDREWGSSMLDEQQAGWDWFSIQLDDGRELMYYRLRQMDGTPGPFNHGVVVAADGSSRRLSPEQVELTALDYWRSPVSGASYPLHWRLRVPGEGLELEIMPRLREQELRGAFRYWEGAIRVTGSDGDGSVTGQGYMELTGY